MIRKLVPLLIFITLVIFLGIGLTRDPRLVPSPLIDKPVPEFSLPGLANADQQLGSSDLKGHISLLNVWASWCVACRAEHPVLLNLAKKNVVTLYGLNYKDNREDALRWLEYYGNPYVESAHDFDGKVGIDFGVYGVPETFIVDKQGVIRYKHIGPITEDTLKQNILPLIDKLSRSTL
jgi:cytochrome c biogenesis protein CcmG, thiol:disulfide interchange protein DsbE